MSANFATDSAESTDPSPLPTSTTRPPLGLWLPTIALIAYWIVVEGSYRLELAMFNRFITRMLALLAVLVFFLVWGLSRRHFTLRQRLLVCATVIASFVVSGLVGHESMDIFATAMFGLPYVLTLSIGWLWWAQRKAPHREFTGVIAISLAVFGVLALTRWDGLDGRQRPDMSWRWSPTAEELYLRSVSNERSTSDSATTIAPGADDWTSFRGGERHNAVTGVAFGDWETNPPQEVWRKRIGPAWSSMITVGDALFTQEQRGDTEAVVCYQAETGKEVWVHTSPDRFQESLSGAGPRATPTFADGRIYSYGALGRLACLDAATGDEIWARKVLEENGAQTPMWGLSVSPLVIDDMVVVFAGGTDGRGVIAYDRTTGEPRWNSPAGTASYATPQLMTIAGERQIVVHDEQSLFSVRPDDGQTLWTHPSPFADSFQPMLQPHQVDDNTLIVGWGPGILRLNVHYVDNKWSLSEAWTSNRLKPSFNEFMVFGDHIYGLDDGILCCVDLEQGQRQWKGGRYGFGQLLLLPDAKEILVFTEQGEFVRVAADPEEHRELGRFNAITGKTWNHPIISAGRLFARNAEEIACFRLP